MYYVSSLVPSEGLVCVCCCSMLFVFMAFGFPMYTTCILLCVFWLPFVYIFDMFIHQKKKFNLLDYFEIIVLHGEAIINI